MELRGKETRAAGTRGQGEKEGSTTTADFKFSIPCKDISKTKVN